MPLSLALTDICSFLFLSLRCYPPCFARDTQVDSCSGPSDVCGSYASSVAISSGGKRAATYIADTLSSSLDSCSRECVLGGYLISLEGTTAALTPRTFKPTSSCTCPTFTGQVSSGSITGSAAMPNSAGSIAFTVSPAEDHLSVALSVAGTSVGAATFSAPGCHASTATFCGDAPPAANDDTPAAAKPPMVPIIAGAVGGLLVIAVAGGAMVFMMRKRATTVLTSVPVSAVAVKSQALTTGEAAVSVYDPFPATGQQTSLDHSAYGFGPQSTRRPSGGYTASIAGNGGTLVTNPMSRL